MTKARVTWVAVAIVGGAVLAADLASAGTPATQPTATTKPAARAGRQGRKLFKPYSDMKTLTPQQQDQIVKIHEDALDQAKKIKEKETDDISALLTPAQQTELSDVEGKAKVDRKTATAKRGKAGATTAPAM